MSIIKELELNRIRRLLEEKKELLLSYQKSKDKVIIKEVKKIQEEKN